MISDRYVAELVRLYSRKDGTDVLDLAGCTAVPPDKSTKEKDKIIEKS